MDDGRLYRSDGWSAVLSGFDKRANKASTEFHRTGSAMSTAKLWDVWTADGYGARVVSCVAEDMVRAGFRIAGDVCNSNLRELSRLQVGAVLYNAMCMSRVFGGSAVLMGVVDGRRMDKPVSVNSIKGMNYLKVFPGPNVKPVDSSLVSDAGSPLYGNYQLFELSDGMSDTPYVVHADRLLLFPWLDATLVAPKGAGVSGGAGKFWGTSVLERIRGQISDVSILSASISNLVQEAAVGKYKLANLANLLASGEKNRILDRMDIIQESKSIINGVLLDADSGEDYTRDTLTFGGIGSVANVVMVFLSAVSGIPVTRLFGRSPSGLDASGESDLTIYYDMVSSYQEIMLSPALQHLVFYVDRYRKSVMVEDIAEQVARSVSRESGDLERKPPVTEADILIEWNSLRQMTQKEQAESYFTNAQADMYYKNMGVLSPEEIRRNRFVNGYNTQISVETSELPDDEEELDVGGDGDDEDEDEDGGVGAPAGGKEAGE